MDILTPIAELPPNGQGDYSELLNPKPKRASNRSKNEPERIDAIDGSIPKSIAAKATTWSTDDITMLSGAFALLLVELTRSLSYWQVDSDKLAMDDLESQVISKAATSIIMRRIKIKGAKKGDISDGLMIMLTMVSYGVRFNNGRRQYLLEKEAETNAKAKITGRS